MLTALQYLLRQMQAMPRTEVAAEEQARELVVEEQVKAQEQQQQEQQEQAKSSKVLMDLAQ